MSTGKGVGDFSHYREDGSAGMVDVSGKKVTARTATATGFVRMKKETLGLIRDKLLPKGEVFEVARVAGIIAAKKTSILIPMCHPLNLNYIDVSCAIDEASGGVVIRSDVKLEGKTGAEMEALTAVSIAALTVFDMCKAVDKSMIIENIRVVHKTGGKSDSDYHS